MSSASDSFEQAKAHFLAGLDHFAAGRHADAEADYRASLALLPGRVSTLVNLAATLLRLGRPQDALEVADQVLAAEPDNFDARFHHASALGFLGRHAEALAGFDKALSLDATLAEPWLRHAQTLQALGRPDQALASYTRALAIDPAHGLAWSHRGGILWELNRLDEAAESFRQAIAHGADAELNGYYMASVAGRTVPAAAPQAYVQSLFDDYAGDFDHHLVNVLNYRAHKVLTDHLAGLWGEAGRRYGSAVDLGCGTGLCGPLVRPLVDRLTGIDLSGEMIRKARALGVYDQLMQGDIVELLGSAGEPHDLALAADVLVYLGDLSPLFAAVARTMPSQGVFCFSAERAQGGTVASGAVRDVSDFELLPSLRYAHTEGYLRRLAGQHGFEVARLLNGPIREDQRESIDGMFVYLVKR